MLKNLENGLPYLSILYELVESGKIRLIPPNLELTRKAYDLSVSNNISVHDAIFVSLALEAGLDLKTFDEEQAKIMQDKAKSQVEPQKPDASDEQRL